MFGQGFSLAEVAVRARGQVGGPVPAVTNVVVIEGDSIAADTQSFTRLWTADRAGLAVHNLAVGGSGVQAMRARSAAAMAKSPTRLFVFIGANDLGSDTAGYLAGLWAYTDPFRATGTKVILGTVLPRTGVADWAAKRTNYNAALRAAVGVKIDDLVDFDTCPMGVAGAELDAAKYPDGLHPNGAGHALLKRVFAPVMNHWVGVPNEPLDLVFAPQAAATPDTDYDSTLYTVAGLYPGEARPCAVAGGAVSMTGGEFVAGGSGLVSNGDTLRVRTRSLRDPAAQIDTTLTIGTTIATYSVTTAGAGARDWVPSDLGAKLKLWLRPEAIADADGAQLATWPDDSGHAVAVTGGGTSARPSVVAGGPNAFRAVKFDGPYGSYFGLPAGYLAGRPASASFAVTRNVADPNSSHFKPPLMGWGTDESGEFFPYVDGSVYSSYATNTRNQTPDFAASLAEWRVASFHSAPNDWRFYIDGTTILALSANIVALGTNPLIGAGFDGRVAEVIDCAAALTTAERQRVEGYLAWKYGLAANLPAGHPYESERPMI